MVAQYNLDPLDPPPVLEEYEAFEKWLETFRMIDVSTPARAITKRGLRQQVEHLRRAYLALKYSQADTQPIEVLDE